MFRLTVADTSNGDRRSSVVDGIDGRVRLTISDEDQLERIVTTEVDGEKMCIDIRICQLLQHLLADLSKF